MLRELVRAVFDDSRRGDDRVGGAGDRTAPAPASAERLPTGSVPACKPPVLRRRTTVLVAIIGIAAIVYGTLAPFQIDPHRSLTWHLDLGRPASGDTLANVVIYVPIGAFLRLILRRRGSSRIAEYALGLSGVMVLSYLTEVLQSIIPARVPCWTDVMCNTAGGLIGIVLAPRIQRGLRNLHADLYARLRRRPLSAAAAAALVCVCMFALTPPDIYPAPGHMSRAVAQFLAQPSVWLGLSPSAESAPLTAVQWLDKVAAASSYGLLAFLLALSASEAGRPARTATWYAFSRSVMVVTMIEAVQLFTISHVADVHDLFLGVCAGSLGALVGGCLICCRPLIHERPAALLRSTAMVVAWGLLAWMLGAVVLQPPSATPVAVSWVPMLDNFCRPWNALLGDYVSGFTRYLLVAGILVVRSRANRETPRSHFVAGFALAVALLTGAAAVCRGQGFDASHLVLAVLAAGVVVRLDRAVFGRRQPVAVPAGR